MDIENIKSRIKKLLALSEDNPSDAESYAALQKAQELMVQYKIDQMDLTDEEKKRCIQRKTNFSYSTRSSDHYLNELATIIADNFCCVNYLSTPRGTRTHYICFMGMEEDVEIAVEALNVSNATIIRGYNKVYKELSSYYGMDYVPAKYFNPAKIGYIEGYMAGLRDAFESQKEQNQEWGLVLVAPQEAQDFMSGLRSVEFNNPIRMDTTFYDDGYTDGKNFNLNKKIEGTKTQGKITG